MILHWQGTQPRLLDSKLNLVNLNLIHRNSIKSDPKAREKCEQEGESGGVLMIHCIPPVGRLYHSLYELGGEGAASREAERARHQSHMQLPTV